MQTNCSIVILNEFFVSWNYIIWCAKIPINSHIWMILQNKFTLTSWLQCKKLPSHHRHHNQTPKINLLIVCYGKLLSIITGYRTNRLLPLRKYSAQHRSQIFIGHFCRRLHWDHACSLLRSAVMRGCRGIRQQRAISHITSITMLSLAICLCAITSTIMGTFSVDKSFANSVKSAADWMPILLFICYM